ncbi:hypothetical protein DUNSADRAFT_10971 [Dunaliella salina]|uniref:Encoded protein n=1 Tax=Dunaliella salina TaxID=3046 RepID=A0ABQ7GEF8_DUNSA|nr:hypothetical protein DUNSADRAFT_10971 [Dunaliella salina]|eukprot:KAF5832984.1 hypothetical protein DUNSADRAFT_10971 [Dunaliella salina]
MYGLRARHATGAAQPKTSSASVEHSATFLQPDRLSALLPYSFNRPSDCTFVDILFLKHYLELIRASISSAFKLDLAAMQNTEYIFPAAAHIASKGESWRQCGPPQSPATLPKGVQG